MGMVENMPPSGPVSHAQFHISGLYPRNRGLISSLFVAGFTGCGIIFYILQRIFEDLGSTQCVPLSKYNPKTVWSPMGARLVSRPPWAAPCNASQ